MSIHSLKISKELRKQGERLGRAGLSERVFTLVDEFNQEHVRSYKNAMVLAGKLKAIAMAAKADGYWDEKVSMGFQSEIYDIENCELPACKPNSKDSRWIK